MTRTLISLYRILPTLAAAFVFAQTVDAQDDVRLHLEEGKSGAVWNLVLSPDGSTLYSCGRDSTAKSWNLATGECIRTFRSSQPTLVTSLSLDASGNYLACGDMNGRLTVWAAREGALRYELMAHERYISDVAITPDGEMLISAGRDDSIRLWKLEDASLIASIHADMLWVRRIAVSPDGRLFAAGGQNGHIRLHALDSASDTLLGTHARYVSSLHFSSDGRFLFSAGAEGDIKVWNMTTLTLYRVFTLENGFAHSMDIDRTGERLLIGRMNGIMEIWDWQRRLRMQTLPAASYGTMSAVFDSSGTRMYSAHTDGSIRIWNMLEASLLLSMTGFSDGQWLSFTPDGYYDCSAFGDRYVSWRRDQEEFPLERYKELYRRPDIIEDVLAGGYVPSGETAVLIHPPTVRLTSPRSEQVYAFGSEPLEIVVEAEARDASQVSSIRIQLNGRTLEGSQFISREVLERSDTLLRLRARIPILPGKNTVEAVALNAARVRSNEARADISVETDRQRDPDLYVLAVGSDQYAPDFPDLRFAATDARSLADELSRQQGGMYTRVYSTVLTDDAATKENIFSALRDFGDMTPRDVLVMFFSGHGVRERDKKGRSRYYYLPSGTKRDAVAMQGMAWDDFTSELSKLSAGRVILLLDACHSGDVSSGASNEKVAASIAGKAGIVFTSSSGNEYSYEDVRWGHGAFTKALLDGMRGAADFTKDSIVDWSELQLYVSTTVRSLTRGAQNPMVPRLEQFGNFDFVRIRR